MRTPTMVYENSLNVAATQNDHQQRHIPIILNKCVKRKSVEVDTSQPHTKIPRRPPNTHQVYYSESMPVSQMVQPQMQYSEAQGMINEVECTSSSSGHHHHHISNNSNNNNNNNNNNLNMHNSNNNSGCNNNNNANDNNNCLMSTTSQNIEYVMFDSNLLPVQNTIISEPNQINLNDINTTWNNSDLLDLDHNKVNNNRMNADYDNGNGLHSEDLEDKNLSWLFNFKLDELPHLSPEVKSRTSRPNVTPPQQNNPISKKVLVENETYSNSAEADDMNIGENVVIENVSTTHTPKKPPFTYTELIEYALEDRGELTVSGIYQWISDRFTFYKSNDDRWKNSVRHNLSINPHFRKGSKAPQGAGHLWTISTRDSETNMLAWEHKKQRLELFLKMEAANMNAKKQQYQTPIEPAATNQTPNIYDETAAAVGSITFMPPDKDKSEMNTQIEEVKSLNDSQNYANSNQTLHIQSTDHDHELRRTAGEILNGVRRNVEVQILNQPTNYNNYHAFTLLESGDYLNPISKDEIAQECGLKSIGRNEHGNDFYITEIDPIELGIHMNSNEQDEVLFGDEFNFTYLGIGSGNNIMA